jgi:hypothetical protein
MTISVDEGVKQKIIAEGKDYRVCTSCTGPALVPITVKAPKESDIRIQVGNNTLYVSRVQAGYINKITTDMFYSDQEIDSCPVFYYR